MRWSDVLLILSVSTASASELQTINIEPSIAQHDLSSQVQEALTELQGLKSIHVSRTKSRSRILFDFLRRQLFTKDRTDPSSTNHNIYESPIRKLKEASEIASDVDATFLLAEISFHGNYSYPRNYHDALKYYTKVAEATGNTTAQENLALLYSTGLQGIEADQGLAITYHTFAASQGSVRSQMALGFRALHGIGLSPNFTAACEYYSAAAKTAVEWIHSGPPGGMYWGRRAYRFADEVGGLYGNIPTMTLRNAVTADSKDIDDVIDYHTYMAEKADIHSSFNLAKLYNEGSRTVEVNFVKSLYWFRQVAKTYWTKDGKTVKGVKALRYHAKSAASIATAYLRGEGTRQDFDKAKMWFLRGIALGDASAQNGYALMHLLGLGPVPKDLDKAEELFRAASENEHAGAHINLGKILAAKGDIITATRLFESAARSWRVEAFYLLAQFAEHGIGRESDRSLATQYYKLVAESVETLHSTIPAGNEAYREGRIEDALIANLVAAETGYEIGQVNVAFLLDKHARSFSLQQVLREKIKPISSRVKKMFGIDDQREEMPEEASTSFSNELALLYYTRAAAQQNVEALVKAGDFYLGGHGTVADPEKAVNLWTTAAESRISPIAFWNLGWSYENGVGVGQDFNLAKRYYDACLEVDKSAYLPVTLSLVKLRLRSSWNTMTGGTVNSIKTEASAESKFTWTSIWTGIRHFWRSQFDSPDFGSGRDHDSGVFVDEDYPVVEENLYDTLFILGVCLLVASIVYMRTTWWPQTRRNHGAGAPPQNNANFDAANLWIGGAAI